MIYFVRYICWRGAVGSLRRHRSPAAPAQLGDGLRRDQRDIAVESACRLPVDVLLGRTQRVGGAEWPVAGQPTRMSSSSRQLQRLTGSVDDHDLAGSGGPAATTTQPIIGHPRDLVQKLRGL